MASWTNATRAPAPGVLRPAATAQRSELRREYPVDPALRPFVERYWSVRWDRRGAGPFRSEVLTHPSVNLAVESGDAPRHGGHVLPAALVHGVVTRRFVIDLTGWGRATAVKFRPGGFRAYRGEPVATDTVHRLADGDALVRAVLRSDDDDVRVAELDAALAARVPEPHPEYLLLTEVLTAMRDSRELTRVEHVAAASGLSTRSVQRLFRRWVGVGPKWVLARHRLWDATAAIDAGGVEDLAALAAELGWFDQAHFSRDFRATVGCTPSEYLAQAEQTR